MKRLLHGAALLALLAGLGCSVVREIPREQFAAQVTRKKVRVTQRDRRTVELRDVRFTADSLVGAPARRVGGGSDAPAAPVGFALDEIAVLEQRQVDWFRTGLVAGTGAAGLLLYLLSQDKEETPAGPGAKQIP